MINERNNKQINQYVVYTKNIFVASLRTQPFMQNRDQNFTQNFIQVFWTKIKNWAGLPLLMAFWPINSGSPAKNCGLFKFQKSKNPKFG